MTTKTTTSTTSTGAHNFTFGVFDKFENKLRMGFVSHDIKQLAIATADRIVGISLAGGEDTYKAYQSKIIGFQDALEIFEMHGFILAIVPNYMEVLLEEGPQAVVSTEKEAFFDGSNEGVKLLNFYHRNEAETVARYYDAMDSNQAERGILNIPNLASEVTWEQAIEVMKKVQKKHHIDLFAPGYFNTCSCCATPSDFPKKYFLNKEDAEEKHFTREDGSKIKFLIIANSHNASGVSKLGTKKKPYPFGTIEDYKRLDKENQQFVRSNALKDEETAPVLEDFVKGLNELVGEETYSLEYPEGEGYAFSIVTKQ